MHTQIRRHTSNSENKEIRMILRQSHNPKLLFLSKCTALNRQLSASAWFLTKAMFGCTSYMAEIFQANVNMKVLLVGESFCFQSSVMKGV